MSHTASLTQQRALAYAPKPFSVCSIVASIYVGYYLVWKHPEKLRRMYHRLVLAAFVDAFMCSICFFIASWALPVDSEMVGSSGNDVTCTIQGAVFTVAWLGLAAYYASLGIYSLVAVKNNFEQEKIRWVGKYIHLWAYAPTLCIMIGEAVYMSSNQGSNPFCYVAKLDAHYARPSMMYTIAESLVLLDFIVGSVTIVYLWWNFSRIQNQVDDYTGMRQLVENARRRRLKDVAQQTMLYLFLFSYGYFVPIISIWIDLGTTGTWVYNLNIVGACMSASQGVVFAVIYFVLQKPELELRDLTGYFASKSTRYYANDTVDEIRENTKKQKKRKTMLPRFSFCIFDGEPAEDSPWAQFFEEDDTVDDETYIESIQEKSVDDGILTALL